MTKRANPRQNKIVVLRPEAGVVHLFVGVSVIVFPALVLIVAAAQFAVQQPRLVLQLIGMS